MSLFMAGTRYRICGAKSLERSTPVQRPVNLAPPELTVALHFAVIASAGFAVDVVLIVSCAQSLAILAFFQNPGDAPNTENSNALAIIESAAISIRCL